MTSWTPGARAKLREFEAPYEDVPPHLAEPLWAWILGTFRTPPRGVALIHDLGLKLRIPIPSGAAQGIACWARLCEAEPSVMLDIAEAMLERFGPSIPNVKQLKFLLDEGHSAYSVREDWWGLELRVPPEIRLAVEHAAGNAPVSAGEFLTDAWNAAYGRRPDASKSYSASIKACEAALAPHVSPANARQTLGTMIRDITAKPEKWRYELGGSAGIPPLVALMRLLWEGQTSRHGSADRARPESLASAQAAVQVAAMLIGSTTSGAFAPVETN